MRFSPEAVDVEALSAQSKHLIRHANYAPSTLAWYAYDWEAFVAWCFTAERDSLPASPETVLLYLTDSLGHRKISTVRRYCSAIQYYHRQEGLETPRDARVSDLFHGAQRLKGEVSSQKRPLTLPDLRTLAALDRSGPLQARNWAILTLGLASALRRSNLVALDLCDVSVDVAGVTLSIRREKRDQMSAGRALGLGRGELCCPVAALEAWLLLRGAKPGPLFTPVWNGVVVVRRLRAPAVAWVVKKAMVQLGRDPREYAAHSLRSGFVTAALDGGTNEILVAAHTGHRSLSSLRLYYRLQDPLRRAVSIGM